MTKAEAIRKFGSTTELARWLEISTQAISQWPEQLSKAKADRVEMAHLRKTGLVPVYTKK